MLVGARARDVWPRNCQLCRECRRHSNINQITYPSKTRWHAEICFLLEQWPARMRRWSRSHELLLHSSCIETAATARYKGIESGTEGGHQWHAEIDEKMWQDRLPNGKRRKQ